jgi:hypothetical protein
MVHSVLVAGQAWETLSLAQAAAVTTAEVAALSLLELSALALAVHPLFLAAMDAKASMKTGTGSKEAFISRVYCSLRSR